jgi:hypothetical protein
MAWEIVKAFFIISGILIAIPVGVWVLGLITEAKAWGKIGQWLGVGMLAIVALVGFLRYQQDQQHKALVAKNAALQQKCIQSVNASASNAYFYALNNNRSTANVSTARSNGEASCRLKYPTY